MGESRVTPEKDLLKLIEGTSPHAGANVQAQAAKRRVGSFFSFGALLGRISYLREVFKHRVKGQKFLIDIKALNRFLLLCIFIVGIYFLVNLAVSISASKRAVNIELSESASAQDLNISPASTLKPAVHYLENAREKNIFSMASAAPAKEEQKKEERDRMSELVKNLKLVGISWSDDPDVIIEDTNLKQAYFLKKGQRINDLTIKFVFKDRIILSYGQEEIELR